jgi:tetratricopeptide (TPR) repeat protein
MTLLTRVTLLVLLIALAACSNNRVPPTPLPQPYPEPQQETETSRPAQTFSAEAYGQSEPSRPMAEITPIPAESMPIEPDLKPLSGYSPTPYGVDPIPAEPPPVGPAPYEPVVVDIPPVPPEYVPDTMLKLPVSPALTPPPEPKEFAMTAPPAVLALESEIQTSMKSGNYADAAATLERAIRIQPKNPELWHVLAKIRLNQQQPGLAEDLAKKSNLLAKSSPELARSNWDIIAQARRSKGDPSGAAEAQARARY